MSERHEPHRGDEVERWLTGWRDAFPADGLGVHLIVWQTIDDMVEDYRVHADTGTPLDAEVLPHDP
jgi:hypothetical protein